MARLGKTLAQPSGRTTARCLLTSQGSCEDQEGNAEDWLCSLKIARLRLQGGLAGKCLSGMHEAQGSVSSTNKKLRGRDVAQLGDYSPTMHEGPSSTYSPAHADGGYNPRI